MREHNQTITPFTALSASALRLLVLLASLGLVSVNAANKITISMPNGFANIETTDLSLASNNGKVRWQHWWDGHHWKFNSQWESLSSTWDTPTCSRVPQPGGSWQWLTVNSSGSTAITTPAPSLEMQPFNQEMGDATNDYPVLNTVDSSIAGGCISALGNNLKAIRKQGELYVGQNGHFVYNNSTVLDLRPVKGLPTSAADTLDAQLATGKITLASVDIPKGFHWTHKEGDWIDYNLRGQVVAYGDNNNTTWLARDSNGILRGVVDGSGQVLLAFHYTGGLLTGVSDFPVQGNELDLPTRTVTYQYDANNRLTKVTDVRGNITAYGYNPQGQLTSVTDPEGRIEKITYAGKLVAQHTAPDGGITEYAFNYDEANHQYSAKISAPTTAAGRKIEDSTYDDSGSLVSKTINGRTDDELSYNTAARTETRTNARGFKTVTTRNEFEQVTRIDYPDGTHVERNYSAQHQHLLEETDEAGIKTKYEYDAKGNLIKTTEAVGTPDERVTEYQVNDKGQAAQTTRKGRTETNGTITPDAVTKTEYDALGQVTKVTDAEGGTTQYSYDRTGNLASMTDALGHTALYQSDPDGNLIKATDAEDRITAYSYDKVGNLTTSTDARGKATQKAYDAMNRLLQTTNPTGGISKTQYDAAGMPTTVTDEDGRTVQFAYDTFQRLVQLTDALGNKTEFGYNIADGSAIGTLGSLSNPTEIKYPTYRQKAKLDQRERINHETLLNPNAAGTDSINTISTYDVRGWVKTRQDANGKTRTYSYNAYGDTVEVTDSLGYKTNSAYDARGNLIQLTDANGNSHTFSYDRNGRLIKETLPLGQEKDYSYDDAGNLTQTIDANDNKATYAYDKTHWLVETKHYKGGTQLVRTTTFTWDAAHNLTGWSDTDATRPEVQQTASSQITYDDGNRKAQETISYPNPTGQAYSLAYSYQYTPAGKKKRLTWADGTAIDYGYSAHGELQTVAIPNEGILSVSQYKWTQPSEILLPGGTRQQKAYDGLLNLEGLYVKNANQQPLLELTNNYSKRLELLDRSRTDTVEGINSTVTNAYTYDGESRLTKAITDDTGALFGSDTETFTLDGVSNRTGHSKNLGDWAYDANNRLTEKGVLLGKTAYDYDSNGNLTQKSQGGNATHYAYDSQNRLIQVSDNDNNPIARYGYDPFDRRIWKEAYRSKDGAPLNQPKRSYYLYSDEGLIAESQQAITPPLPVGEGRGEGQATTEPTITTQYGPRPDGEFTTDVLFLKTKNSAGGNTIAYYHHDHLGTPIQATDRSGIIVWSAQYNAFGKVSITTPTATGDKPVIESNLRFPGQVEDAETGLYYNWHRYYDPELGRYVTADPIGLDGGVNLYAYVGGNPVNAVDPLGLDDTTGTIIRIPIPGAPGLGGNGTNDINAPSPDYNYPERGRHPRSDVRPGRFPRSATDENCPPDGDDKCDKKLSDEFLEQLGIDAHAIKRDMVPGGGWGAYNLCGCGDGRILLKRSKDCKDPGGEDTGERWK
jgi:RHS repeat-associated protein